MKLPDQDKLKQRVIDILAEWDQLLLNDTSVGGWVRTSPGLSIIVWCLWRIFRVPDR